jgi:hypothetical protein
MNRGFYLTLMMGSFSASPVPEAVIDALTDIQVTSSMDSQSGFQLNFTLGKNSLLQQMLVSGYFDPRTRVIIAVTVNGATSVLIDGIITRQDVTPNIAAGKSTLAVTGLDLTALMDFIDLTGIPYPSIPLFAIVELVLAKYVVLGVTPLAIPTLLSLVSNPLDQYPKQFGTDYAYITSLASEVGAVFYLDPGPQPGQSTAYWGPDITSLFGGTQPAISINMDANTTVDSMSFSYDGTLATQYLVTIIDPDTGTLIPDLPVPNIDLLKPSLAQKQATPLKTEQLGPLSGETPISAELIALGKLMVSSEAITGSGELDVLRYGYVFKVRQRAAVRGAGQYYDGEYYVKSVTHTIKRGQYKQSFSLARGGVGSTVSTVSV